MANTPNNAQTKKFDENKFSVTGRLTKDPEIRNNSTGQYGMFTIANNRGDNTNFFTFFVKETQVPFLTKYFTKGCLVDVTGTIVPSTETEPDGTKKTAIKLIVSKMGLVGVPGASTPVTNNTFANNQMSQNNGYAPQQQYNAVPQQPIAQPQMTMPPQMQNTMPQQQQNMFTPPTNVSNSYDDDDLPF